MHQKTTTQGHNCCYLNTCHLLDMSMGGCNTCNSKHILLNLWCMQSPAAESASEAGWLSESAGRDGWGFVHPRDSNPSLRTSLVLRSSVSPFSYSTLTLLESICRHNKCGSCMPIFFGKNTASGRDALALRIESACEPFFYHLSVLASEPACSAICLLDSSTKCALWKTGIYRKAAAAMLDPCSGSYIVRAFD